MRLRSLLLLQLWLGAVVACSSSTGPGYTINGTWLRSDNNDTTWFDQNGQYVGGIFPQGGFPRVICGTLSGNTVKLTFQSNLLFPDRGTYDGTFTRSDMIEGTYTDSSGATPLNFLRVVADTPSTLDILGQCSGFPYGARVR